MNSVEHINWGCPRKRKARYETILSAYRNHIGPHLPLSKQYYTLCGHCTTDAGHLINGCELDQMLSEGLIFPSQWHGVDIDGPTITTNQKLVGDYHWHHGDFYSTLVDAYNKGTLSPGVVNFDCLLMPQLGMVEFSNVLYLLSCINNLKGCLLIGNFILRQRCISKSSNEIITALEEQPRFHISMRRLPWQCDWRTYSYNGSGQKRATWMGSIVFWV